MNPGRNDPCPCGSGEKYKNCCGLAKRTTGGAASEDCAALANTLHKCLFEYADKIYRELPREIRRDYERIEEVEAMACRIDYVLGKSAAKDVADMSMRTLFTDAFDALYSARALAQRRFFAASFTLLRRALESTSLLRYFHMMPDEAKRWASGAEILNRDVRMFLEKHEMAADAGEMRSAYALHAKFAHPNSSFLVKRGSQEPEGPTLGPYSPVSNDIHHVILALSMLQWESLMSAVLKAYGESVVARDAGFGKDVISLNKRLVEARRAASHRIEWISPEVPATQ